jgi:hypothetical protein
MGFGWLEILVIALLAIGIPSIFVTVAVLMRRNYKRSFRR